MATAPEHWQEVKRVLSAALEREPSERSAYLDQVCTEPSLRQEVESLIAAHEQVNSSFLERPPAEPPRLNSGVKLGSYEIIAPLGAGGMGVVYKAKDTHLPRQVALKVLPPSFASDADALLRFRREAEVLASLSHPNIVTIHEIGQEAHTLYIAMEFVDGKLLSDVLTAGRMAMEEVFEVATQIATGLACAHRSGIIHRDLKPKNIVIRQDGLVKILDFGLGKLASNFPPSPPDETTALTGPRTILGTADYMSPQQAAGLPLDFHSDQFSFGSVLYEMATGRRPFRRRTAAQTLAAIIEDEPEPATSLNRKVPKALDGIIRRCLRKNPAERYASTDELARELKERREECSRNGRPHTSWALPPLLAFVCLLAAGGIWAIAPRLPEALFGITHVPRQKQLAVLQFRTVEGDPEAASFTAGLSDVLTAKLTQLTSDRFLQVVPATEIQNHHVTTIEQASSEFGVNLVLEGSLAKSGDLVRVNYNLVDARTRRQLRADSITVSGTDAFAVQDRVVNGVVRMLELEVQPEQRQILATHGTQVPAAYGLYLEGTGYLQNYAEPENIESAIIVFRQALMLDSNYALAYAGLGSAYWKKYENTKDTQWVNESRESCERALSLDSKLAAAHVCLGTLYAGTGSYGQATEEFERALQAEPTDDTAYRGLASAYERLGKPAEAERTFERAISLRPDYWAGYMWLGAFYYRRARYADAEKMFQKVVTLAPESFQGYYNLGAVYVGEGHYADAIQALEQSIAIRPSPAAYSNLGTAYFYLRRYEDAAPAYEEALKLNGNDYMLWWNLGDATYWIPGRREEAAAAYRQAISLAQQSIEVNARDAYALSVVAACEAMLGERTQALGALNRALKQTGGDPELRYRAAVVYNQLGDRSQSLAWLEKAVAAGFSSRMIRDTPNFDSLQMEPRFIRLLGFN